MRRTSTTLFCTAALTLSVISAPARAGEPDGDLERARELSSRAEDLLQQGDYEAAIESIESAEKHVHSLAHTLLSARAHAQWGKLLEARRLYQEIVSADAAKIKPPPKVQSWKWTPAQKDAHAEATKELPALTPRIPLLTVTVTGAAPSELKVTVDGASLDVTKLDQEAPQDPGEHTITAEAPGKNRASQRVNLKEGAKETVTLALTPVRKPLEPTSVPTGAIAAFGAGGAGVLVWVIAGGIAIAEADKLQGACPAFTCPPSGAPPSFHSAVTASRVSSVGLGVALAGAAVGTLLFFEPWKKDAPRSASVAVGLGFVGVNGSF